MIIKNETRLKFIRLMFYLLIGFFFILNKSLFLHFWVRTAAWNIYKQTSTSYRGIVIPLSTFLSLCRLSFQSAHYFRTVAWNSYKQITTSYRGIVIPLSTFLSVSSLSFQSTHYFRTASKNKGLKISPTSTGLRSRLRRPYSQSFTVLFRSLLLGQLDKSKRHR